MRKNLALTLFCTAVAITAAGIIITPREKPGEVKKEQVVHQPSVKPPGISTAAETKIPDIRGSWEARETTGESTTRYTWVVSGENRETGRYTMNATVFNLGASEAGIPQEEKAEVVGSWDLSQPNGIPTITLKPEHNKNLSVIRNITGWNCDGTELPKAIITSAPKGGETLIWRKNPGRG